MPSSLIHRLEQSWTYLESRTEIVKQAFAKIPEKLKEQDIDFLLLLWTYEDLECYVKSGKKIAPVIFEAPLVSKDTLNAFQQYAYDEESALEDFLYWEQSSLCITMVKMWLTTCFHEAGLAQQISFPAYYKSNFDDEEIWDLKECRHYMEKSMIDNRHVLNQKMAIDVLPQLGY